MGFILRRNIHFASIACMEKKVPDKKLMGTIIKLETLDCISQVKNKKPTIEPIEEKIREVRNK